MATNNTDIKKINSIIDKIENVIDKQGKYIYSIVDDTGTKLVSKGADKEETKQIFLSKLQGKTKYINKDVYEITISVNKKYITTPSKFIVGPVSLKIKQYILNKNYKLKHHAEHKSGAVWYTNKDLLNNQFHFTDLKNIIDVIHDNNIDILNIAGVR